MIRNQINNKVLILGIDGMDPRFSNRMLKKGKMPNLQKLIDRGSCREDLMMLGSHPTGTPPMWTTLATGANPYVHGITDFTLDCELGLDYIAYAFDSRRCTAEQLWNVTTEAGMKTLVFHWPGSSWPPSSDSELLHVIDGTEPIMVNFGTGVVDGEIFITASPDIPEARIKGPGEVEGIAPCVIDDLETDGTFDDRGNPYVGSVGKHAVLLSPEAGGDGFNKAPQLPYSLSPLTEAKNWGHEVPEGALEFVALLSDGAQRRNLLLLKNEEGKYDTIELYRSKKDPEPLAVMHNRDYVGDVLEENNKGGQVYQTNRAYTVLEIAEDGSLVRMFASKAMNINDDSFYSPKSLYRQMIAGAGYVPTAPMTFAVDRDAVFALNLRQWDEVCDWQVRALHTLISENEYDVVFSHMHNIDAQAHMIIRHMKTRDYSLITEQDAIDGLEGCYEQTDRYIGGFLHYIDEGWDLLLISDHALVCTTYGRYRWAEPFGVNVQPMRELGYTQVLQDEDGNDIDEIDWANTTAIAARTNNIYINLKGRDKHTMPDGTVMDGIVDPADKWALEEKIITDMYNLRHPISGERFINLAIRNKDAVLLGMGGEHCGDILYWTADGYNDDHFDGLSTCEGLEDTSLSPIFVAAGPSFKAGFKTDRVIRETDVTPTVATILGVRMPAQCEGAAVYQIFKDEI